MRHRLRVWLLLFPLLILIACGRHPAHLTEQEKQTVSELTANLKPRCVGRYLIDMPADALVSGDATVQGVKIGSVAMSHEAYSEEVASRRSELRGTKSIDPYPFLYADDAVQGPNTHYFIYRGNLSDGPARRLIEAYKWDRGYRFKLEIEGSDYLHPDQTNKPFVKELAVKNDVPEKTHLVFDMIGKLRGRVDDEVPSEPGLCFQGGFLPGKAGDREDVGFQFVLHDNRDVYIGFESDSGIRETTTLLQRGDQINASLKSLDGGRTIRKGVVPLNELAAEEWLMAGRTSPKVLGNIFTLEANSTTSNAQSPLVTLDMSTGSPNAFMKAWDMKSASLSEGQAVALWDAVSRTLRPRPNGF
ncbi:T6SS immunity protein Tli4 family protein [Paraburkholderia sp. MM6662-R1]|uniref:T6SS immunity protein Tli4 family protein n=1 Tax=Paraburkholderia sp. MM6662-R1 TaxID=2991066 RepID=UPI003D23658A